MFDKPSFIALWRRIDSGVYLFGWVNRLPCRTAYLLATVLLVAIAAADYATQIELKLSPYYCVPCFLIDWRIGRTPALVYAVFAGALQWLVELTGTHTYPVAYYLYIDIVLNLVFCVAVIWIVSKLRQALEMEKILAHNDFLTKLSNRSSLVEHLNDRFERCLKQNKSLTLVMIDLDQFRAFNQRLGFSTGDMLLAAMGQLLQDSFRGTDIIARTGDDEFTLILPTMTADIVEAKLLGLRNKFKHMTLSKGWDVTHSIAAMTFEKPTISGEDALTSLKKLMRENQNSGNSCFVTETFTDSELLYPDDRPVALAEE